MRGPHYLKYSIQQTPFPSLLVGISWESLKYELFQGLPLRGKPSPWFLDPSVHPGTTDPLEHLGPPGLLLVKHGVWKEMMPQVCVWGCVFPVIFHDKGWPSSADWYFPPAPFTQLFSQLSHRCPLHPHELSANLHCALCCLLNMQLCPESHNVLGLDFNNSTTFTVTY